VQPRRSDFGRRAARGVRHLPDGPAGFAAGGPFGPEYRDFQLELYRQVSGRAYSTDNEARPFDVERAVLRPFPFLTGSCVTTGEHVMAMGFLLRAMALPPNSRVLEFGPGWGNTTIMLAKLGHRVTAVDIEPRFCELLRRRAEREGVEIEVVNADFLWVEEAGAARFDTVLFFECFHHCADHLRLLRALRGALAPGGRVFFGAEPIAAGFPMPWGLRLDGCSLWAIRKNGWMELGFRDDYFREALGRTGWLGRKHACADPPWLTVWEAGRREEMALRFAAHEPPMNTQVGQRRGGLVEFLGAEGTAAGSTGPPPTSPSPAAATSPGCGSAPAGHPAGRRCSTFPRGQWRDPDRLAALRGRRARRIRHGRRTALRGVVAPVRRGGAAVLPAGFHRGGGIGGDRAGGGLRLR
jgi:SAM-dependent methyltransferase